MVEISFEGFAAFFGDLVFGERHSSFERFLARNVSGVLKLACVDADVAVRRFEKVLELGKTQPLVYREGADDAQAHALVNYLVEVVGDVFRRLLDAQAMRTVTA